MVVAEPRKWNPYKGDRFNEGNPRPGRRWPIQTRFWLEWDSSGWRAARTRVMHPALEADLLLSL
jgi:hypothetical protein